VSWPIAVSIELTGGFPLREGGVAGRAQVLQLEGGLAQDVPGEVALHIAAAPGGGAPVAGVTITLIDADGNRIDIVSAENGNFWSDQAPAFPVTAYASSCPDVVPMMTLAEAGDCNTCHAAGAAITFAP
jgi:hypothetical protein